MASGDAHLLGALTQIEGQIAKLLSVLERARHRGAIDHFELIPFLAGDPTNYEHRGEFAGVAILNNTDQDVYVGFSPDSAVATQATWTLRARSYIVLPVRGSVVSVGAAVAGSVLLIPFMEPPEFAVGPIGAFSGSSSLGVTASGVYSNPFPTLVAGQTSPLDLDSRGNLRTTIVAGDGTAEVVINNPTADGDIVNQSHLIVRALLEAFDGSAKTRVRMPTTFKTVAAVAVVAGTGATIWTPAAGKKFRLMGWSLSASAAASLIFGDNAVGTVLHRTELLAAAGISQVPPGFGNGELSAAANNVLKLDVTANATVSGFVFGTEE